MKKLFFSLSFVLALGAAFFSYASSGRLATHYYQADPNDKENTCVAINCAEDQTQPVCNLVNTGYSTYKSVDPQPKCNSLITLRRKPN